MVHNTCNVGIKLIKIRKFPPPNPAMSQAIKIYSFIFRNNLNERHKMSPIGLLLSASLILQNCPIWTKRLKL